MDFKTQPDESITRCTIAPIEKIIGVQSGGCGDLTVRLRPSLVFQPYHADIFLNTLEKVLKKIKTVWKNAVQNATSGRWRKRNDLFPFVQMFLICYFLSLKHFFSFPIYIPIFQTFYIWCCWSSLPFLLFLLLNAIFQRSSNTVVHWFIGFIFAIPLAYC